MQDKRVSNFKKLKVILMIVVSISIVEGIMISKLIQRNKWLDVSRNMRCEDSEKATVSHKYRVKIFNYDRDLSDVTLRYKTFAYETVSIGDLAALDIHIKDPIQKKKNAEEYFKIINIDNMVSPVFFEVTGTRKDGTVFKGEVSGFDVYSENELFEVYIYKDREGLNYY